MRFICMSHACEPVLQHRVARGVQHVWRCCGAWCGSRCCATVWRVVWHLSASLLTEHPDLLTDQTATRSGT
jgi:hypothetical protein